MVLGCDEHVWSALRESFPWSAATLRNLPGVNALSEVPASDFPVLIVAAPAAFNADLHGLAELQGTPVLAAPRILPDPSAARRFWDRAAQYLANSHPAVTSRRSAVFLNRANELIAAGRDRATLLQAICDLAVSDGGFRAVRALRPDPESERIRVLAQAGESREIGGSALAAVSQGSECVGRRGGSVEAVFPIGPRLALWFEVPELEVQPSVLRALASSLRSALDRIEADELRDIAAGVAAAGSFDSLPDTPLMGYWDWRVAENRGELSSVSKRMFGYEDTESPLPSEFEEAIEPEDLERAAQAFRLHVQSRGSQPYYVEFRFRRRQGPAVWIAAAGKVIEWSEAGEPLRVVGCHLDITARKLSENQVRNSETLYRTLFESAQDAILLFRTDGHFVAANPAAVARLGYTQDELAAIDPVDVVAPEGRRQFARMTEQLRSVGRAAAEMTCAARDGTRFPVEITAAAFQLSGQQLALAIVRDVTERKRVEAALRQSEEKFFRAFEDAPMLISISSVDEGRYLNVNRRWEEASGWSREEAIGRRSIELGFMPAEERAWMVRTLREKGSVSVRETDLKARDGSRIVCSYNAQIVSLGGEARILAIGQDITYRKRYEEERELMLAILRLANSPNDTRELIQAVTGFLQEWSGCEAVGIRLRDGDDFPYYESRGLSREFLLVERSLCSSKPVPEVGAAPLECLCGAVLSGPASALASRMTPGCSFWTNGLGELLATLSPAETPPVVRGRCHREGFESLALIPLQFAGKPIGLLQFCDRRKGLLTAETISLFERVAASVSSALEQRRMRSALKASEEQYRLISENTVDVIWLWDLRSGRLSYVSPSIERISGYTRDEVLSFTARDLLENSLFSRVAAELPARVAAAERGESNGAWTAQAEHHHRDGSMLHIEVVTALLMDEDGRVSQVLGVTRDITDRLRAAQERERLEQQLLQAQKLESVGRLAGGVAHDFNNLLTVINGYGDLALRSLRDGDPLKKNLTEIRRAGERAAALTSQLLAFSRRQVAEPRVINLSDLVLESRDMVQHVLGEAIDLTLSLSPRIGRVFADPGQLHQVLMNLVVNARDAMTDRGKLTIETDECDTGEAEAAGAGVKPGVYVTLTITDTGCGIEPGILGKVFEPFFTTKMPGKGTGLGLSTVYGIVRQCGGWVSVVSEPGRGTSFHVHLPRAEGAVQETIREEFAANHRTGETVLVVEDQSDVRRLVIAMLGNFGYHTLEASSGEEAMSIAERYPGTIHLMITDVMMPRMSGIELAAKVAPVRPKMKCLFMSGYAGDRDRDPGETSPNFISKPFTPEQIAAKVRSALSLRKFAAP